MNENYKQIKWYDIYDILFNINKFFNDKNVFILIIFCIIKIEGHVIQNTIRYFSYIGTTN